MALEGLEHEKRHEDAQRLLDNLAAKQIPRAVIEAGRARLAFAFGQRAEALRYARNALSAMEDKLAVSWRRFIADAFNRIGDHGPALPIWETIAAQTRQAPDVWALLDTAKRLDRPDVIVQVADEWRAAGARDRRLIEEELAVLGVYRPQKAVERLQGELAFRPEDSFLLLRLSCLGHKLGRPDLICRDVTRLPIPEEAGPENGAIVVRLLADSGKLRDALSFAYRLLRHFPDTPHSHAAFAWLMLDTEFNGTLSEAVDIPETAGPGTAVRYSEQGTSVDKWVVIEDETEGNRFDDELPSDHALAKALQGAKPGDEILVSGDAIDGQKLTVRELKSKYAYRVAKILDEWNIRFYGQPGFEKLHIEGAGSDDDRPPDLTPIVRRVHARKRGIDSLLETYREHPVPISMLAEATGTHYVRTLFHLAENDGLFIRCCSPDREEFRQAGTNLEAASGCVLDLSAIATLWKLGLEERLQTWSLPLVVSTTTLIELRNLRDELSRTKQSGQVVPTDSGFGLRFVEANPQAAETVQQSLDQLVELIEQHTEMHDCHELAELDPEQRNRLIDVLEQHGAEAVVLASNPGYVLWTDDAAVADMGRHECGVRRIWTQIALAQACTDGVLTESDFHQAAAKLIGYDYQSAIFEIPVLRAACELAEWHVGTRPLKQVLRLFSLETEPIDRIRIAAFCLRDLLAQGVMHPHAEQIGLAILDRIADGPLGADGVRGLLRTLPRLFGLDVGAINALDGLIRQWLSVRGGAA